MPRYTPSPKYPWLYLPDGWDDNWKAAKSAGGSVRVNIIGDSIAAGGGTASFSQAFYQPIITTLQAQYGTYANFYHAWVNTNDTSISGAPWTDNQTCTRHAQYPWTSTVQSSNVGVNAIQTFTTPYACTALDFLWFSATAASGTFKWAVDGGAQTQVTNSGDNNVHRIQVTSLSNATHTFAWGWQSGANACQAMGCVIYQPNASSGVAAGHMMASSNTSGDINNGWLANTQGVTGVPTNPDLVLIQLATNDISLNNPTVTQYRDNIGNMIRSLRRQKANVSIMHILTSYPDPNNDDCNPSGYSNNGNARQYHAEIFNNAFQHKCAVANIHGKWGATPYGQGFTPNNDLHPTPSGHTDIANLISPVL
jgi:lysophospholipase L1-like esterase